MVVKSGERDRCLRRGICCLCDDLACIRLATELMKGVGLAGWLGDLNEENADWVDRRSNLTIIAYKPVVMSSYWNYV
jgi:hypothetical protein